MTRKKTSTKKGRPYGGLGVLIDINIKYNVIESNKYFIIIATENLTTNVTLANVYFPPYDSRKNEQDNFNALSEILGALTSRLESYCNIVLCGDINYHYSANSHRTKQIQECFDNLDLKENSDLQFYSPNEYSYKSFINGSTSILDRILCSYTLASIVKKAEIRTDYVNSDHHICSMELKNGIRDAFPKIEQRVKPNLLWNIANESNILAYKEKCRVSCRKAFNAFLKDRNSNLLIQNTTEALESAANQNIPKAKQNHVKKHSISGWNQFVQPIANELKFLKNLQPTPEIEAKIKLTKSRYKSAVRQLQTIKQTNIAEITALDNCKVFKHINHKSRDINKPSKINNCDETQQIDMWYEHFTKVFKGAQNPCERFYNDHKTSSATLGIYLKDIEAAIKSYLPKAQNKAYEHNQHYLHAPREAYLNIAIGLNDWCRQIQSHGNAMNFNFLETSISPIPKQGKKDYSDIKSWRPIACSSTICYLLEKILLSHVKPYLETLDNQFAYKEKHGCVHAISIIKQAGQKLTDFHVALLDATAAFDNISWKRIKAQLQKRSVPTYLQSIIFGLMINTSFRIKWNGQASINAFYPTRGVKQGGCLSALIFACCYDDLIRSCKNSNSGIFLNGTFINILIYADDILLTASSSYGLKSLLEITKSFCSQFNDIVLNDSKSIILRMGTKGAKSEPKSLDKIPTAKSAKYLGAYINDDIKEEARVVRCLYTRTNSIFRQNSNLRLCSMAIKTQVLNAYGGVYAIESFIKITSKMRAAHRLLTKNIFRTEWKEIADLNNNHGWVDIKSRTLYAGMRLRSLPETHRWMKNSFIIKSRSSSDSIIRNILGSIDFV